MRILKTIISALLIAVIAASPSHASTTRWDFLSPKPDKNAPQERSCAALVHFRDFGQGGVLLLSNTSQYGVSRSLLLHFESQKSLAGKTTGKTKATLLIGDNPPFSVEMEIAVGKSTLDLIAADPSFALLEALKSSSRATIHVVGLGQIGITLSNSRKAIDSWEDCTLGLHEFQAQWRYTWQSGEDSPFQYGIKQASCYAGNRISGDSAFLLFSKDEENGGSNGLMLYDHKPIGFDTRLQRQVIIIVGTEQPYTFSIEPETKDDAVIFIENDIPESLIERIMAASDMTVYVEGLGTRNVSLDGSRKAVTEWQSCTQLQAGPSIRVSIGNPSTPTPAGLESVADLDDMQRAPFGWKADEGRSEISGAKICKLRTRIDYQEFGSMIVGFATSSSNGNASLSFAFREWNANGSQNGDDTLELTLASGETMSIQSWIFESDGRVSTAVGIPLPADLIKLIGAGRSFKLGYSPLTERAMINVSLSGFERAYQDWQACNRTLGLDGSTAPSFDCSKANSDAERLICSDPELAQLDATLEPLFLAAKKRVSTERYGGENPVSATGWFLDNAEEEWRWREDNCHDRACLLQWYKKRFAVLDWVTTAYAPFGDQGIDRIEQLSDGRTLISYLTADHVSNVLYNPNGRSRTRLPDGEITIQLESPLIYKAAFRKGHLNSGDEFRYTSIHNASGDIVRFEDAGDYCLSRKSFIEYTNFSAEELKRVTDAKICVAR